MIQALFKISKWLFISIVSLILVISLICVGLLYSQSGLRLVIWGAEKALPELTVAQVEGQLGRQFTLGQIEFHQPQNHLDVSLESLTLAIRARCLFQPAVCIEQLSLNGLKLNLPQLPESSAVTDTASSDSDPLKVLNAPLPIQLNKIELNDIDLNLLGNQISWQQFATGLNWRRNKLVINETLWQSVNLALAETETSSSDNQTSQAATTSSQQPIALPEVWIPLSVELKNFAIGDFTLQQATPVVVNQLTFAGQALHNDVQLNSFKLDMPQVDAEATAKVTLADGYPLQAELKSTAKLAEAQGQQLSATVSGSLNKLGVELELSGRASGQIAAQLEPLQSQLPFSVSIKQLQGQWPLVADQPDYRADIASANVAGSLEQFTLDMQGKVTGKTIPQMVLQLAGQGSQNDIRLSQVEVQTLGGGVSGTIEAAWAGAVKVNTHLKLNNIQPAQQWPQVDGEVNGELVAEAVSGDGVLWQVVAPKLDIYGTVRGYPLDVNGALKAFQNNPQDPINITTSGLTLAHGANNIYVKGSLAKQWNMAVQINMPQLDKSVDGLSGELAGNIQLSGAFNQPDIEVGLRGEKVAWQDLLDIGDVTLQGQVQLLPQPGADLQLAVNNLKAQDQYLNHIDLAVKGSLTQHSLSLATQADWGSTLVELQGSLNQAMTQWAGQLDRVEINSDPNRLYLEAPTKIVANIDKQQVTLDAHCWRESSASLCLEQRSSFSALAADAQLALNGFSFAQIAHWLPEDTQLVGRADADIDLHWRKDQAPKVTADVRFGKGYVVQALSQPLRVGWDDLSLQANLAENLLDSQARLNLTENGSLALNLTLADVTAEERQMDGNLSISQITLDALAPLLGEYSKANSLINSQIDLKGTLLHPQAIGQLTVKDIVVQGELTPVDVNQGQLTIDFNGYQANLLAQLDTADGRLNVDGNADWQDMQQWSVNSRVYADRLAVKMPPMVDIQASPDLKLSMVPGKAQVDGEISLPWGRIVVDELPQSAVSVSSDQVLVDENLQPLEQPSSLPMKIETNVRVNIGDDFRLEAFGLKGNLTGQLNVTQRDNAPFVAGEVNIVDGTYRSFGQDLVIQEGKVLMSGPVAQPYLSITAIRNPDNIEDDVTAGIKVTGSAENPSVVVFSDPSMASANALSYLLRGRNLDAESGDNSMTTTLIGLSLAQSGKLVGEIGQAFGVQDLQLDTSGSGDDSQVTVSGYVLPGLQVKYGVGIFNSLGEFTLRYRLMKDLYIEAVSGLTSAVDILYQFEFD